jgi:Uma2 family endonuclease
MMKSVPQHSMTVDEFLAWGEAHHGRYELQDGTVIAMAPERASHWDAKFAVALALREAIERSNLPCFAVPDGATLRISDRTAFEPDAMVYCGERVPPDSLEIPNPVIVVEVLSPSTSTRDVGHKLSGYFTVPSVQHYLIIDTDARMVIHHARAEGGKLITRLATEGVLLLDPPGLELPIPSIFA